MSGSKAGTKIGQKRGRAGNGDAPAAAAPAPRVGLWNEGAVAELEKQADAEAKREARKRATRARKRQKTLDAAEELEEAASRADVIVALDMSTSPGLAIVDRSDPAITRYFMVGFSQTDKQQTMFDAVSAKDDASGDPIPALGTATLGRPAAQPTSPPQVSPAAQIAPAAHASMQAAAGAAAQTAQLAGSSKAGPKLAGLSVRHAASESAQAAANGEAKAAVKRVSASDGEAKAAVYRVSASNDGDANEERTVIVRSITDGIAKTKGHSPRKSKVYLHVRRAPKAGQYAHNTEYYELITKQLMDFIRPFADPSAAKRVLVVLEAYAYHVLHSSSVTALAELGGVMRNKLFQAKLPFMEVSPTSIKKWFTGSGSADKAEMWSRFQTLVPEVDLKQWLPAPFTRDKIPSPHQDIVDAFASAYSLHRDTWDAHQKIKRKERATAATASKRTPSKAASKTSAK